MPRFRPVAVVLVLIALLGPAGAAPAADAPAPRVILAPAEFVPADHAGKVLVVDFWASWCKPCGKSLPWLSRLAAAHGAEGLTVVAVNLDKDLAAAQAMIDALDPAILVVHDPEGALAGRYELEGMPSAFVYDRRGGLRARHVGFLPAEAAAKEQEILTLLHEEARTDAP